MSPVKEPSYFAAEVRPAAFHKAFRAAAIRNSERLRHFLDHAFLDHGGPGTPSPQGIVCEREHYLKLFREAKKELAIGEASVCYLWSATAAANIRATVPEARIIVILRDPVERAFSQYLHNVADGVVKVSFREQIERGARHALREFQPLYPFLENGLYYEQVKRYLDVFPRQNVRALLYEEAWADTPRFLSELFEFLRVDPAFQPDLSAKELERREPRSAMLQYWLNRSGFAPRLRTLLPDRLRQSGRAALFKAHGPTMEGRDREFLRNYYRDDVEKLAKLLGRDLQAWLD